MLVQPPCWVTETPPYNISLLKAVCQSHGFEVVCLDLNIKFYNALLGNNNGQLYNNPPDWINSEYVRKIIENYNYVVDKYTEYILGVSCRVVGFTVNAMNKIFAEELAKRIKYKDKDKIIIFGGPECFSPVERKSLLLGNNCVDAVCSFEGEKALPLLLTCINNNREICVPGIVYRNNDKIIDGGDVSCVDDLNSLPFADYSDFQMDSYTSKALPISTSRGCINKCLFCSEFRFWRKYRYRDAENIFEEIRCQKQRSPSISHFFFNDSLINGNIRNLDKLCQLIIDSHLDISWGGQAAIREEMTPDFIAKMKAAGFSHVSYGLESASPKMLKIMGKRFAPEVAERVIRSTKKMGIRTCVNIIVGFPGEEEEDILATAKFLRRNKEFIDEMLFHPLVINRGAYLDENRELFGIKLNREHNLYDWYSTKEDNSLAKRIDTIKFYKHFIGIEGKSFFRPAEYYLCIADSYYSKEDYLNAFKYYIRAKRYNTDKFREPFIAERLQKLQEQLKNL